MKRCFTRFEPVAVHLIREDAKFTGLMEVKQCHVSSILTQSSPHFQTLMCNLHLSDVETDLENDRKKGGSELDKLLQK